jgi:hypothetical protein
MTDQREGDPINVDQYTFFWQFFYGTVSAWGLEMGF